MQTVDPIDEWRNTIQNYQDTKTSLQFYSQPQRRVTHKEMKEIETMYNPILQTYVNPQLEKQVRHQEKNNFIETLAKNKDRALRYEQTFDVINFEDKLKGLEDKEGYPKPKNQDKAVVGGTRTFTEYNILSNLPFTEHHYLPPDQRPPPPKEKPKKNAKVTTTGLRDYNIITNRYLELNDEKVEVDKEIERLNAAKKYWKTHDFDPVNIQYYDPDKETDFVETRKIKDKTHGQDWVQKLPKSWKEEGGLYNPVNGRIQDEKRLYERDLKEKNKRKRYELRYDMERQIHHQALGEEERTSKISLNKINVQRFNDTTARGFDILTNKQYNNPAEEGSKMLHDPQVKPPPSTWTKIKNSSNAFDEFSRHESDVGGVTPKETASIPKPIDEVKSGDLNDDLYNTLHGDFRQMIERRSKRLVKGSKTMSNFHRSTGAIKSNPIQSFKPAEPVASKPANIVNRETNASALRKSTHVASNQIQSNQASKNESTASIAGRNVMKGTPKSIRPIRTGAFQRINS